MQIEVKTPGATFGKFQRSDLTSFRDSRSLLHNLRGLNFFFRNQGWLINFHPHTKFSLLLSKNMTWWELAAS